MNRVGIVAKPDAAQAPAAVGRLVRWLQARGLAVVLDKDSAGLVPDLAVPTAARSDLPGQVDFLVVLGGDGTLLSVARTVGELGLPLLGVNLGGLGFLTTTTLEEMPAALAAFLEGRMVVEERMMLTARVRRQGRVAAGFLALNDVVVMKSATSRIIDFAMAVDGLPATAYRADGLIIATPTGSTAYSLSAGGPILLPTMDAVVITPVCSHTLTNRPIVLPGTSRIEVVLHTSQDVTVTVDGQVGFNLRQQDVVEVERAGARMRLVRFPHTSFFSVLRTKLKWGER